MVLVKVHRVTSVSDPETGQPGKQIELVEFRRRGAQSAVGMNEEAKLVKGIVSQFQSMGVFPIQREFNFPKMILFLTEGEYDVLGIRFDVNEVYELSMKDGNIVLAKSIEGV